MSGPWEKFQPQTATAPAASGPWTKFQAASPKDDDSAQADSSDLLDNPVSVGADQVGRNIPILGPATVKAGHAFAAGLGSITPDSMLGDDAKGKSFSDLYDQLEKQDQQKQADTIAKHPVAALVGGGIGAGMVPIPGVTVGKEASLLQKAGAGMINAGMAGETAKADSLVRGRTDDQADDAGNLTSLLGLGLGAAGSVAGATKRALSPSNLATKAGDKAVEALNPNLSQMERLEATKDPTQVGRRLLDEGVVTPFASKADMAGRLENKLQSAGQDIGGRLKGLDELTSKLPNAEDYRVNPEDVADNVQRLVRDPASKMVAYKSSIPALDGEISNLRQAGTDGPWSLADANKQKSAYDDLLRWHQEQSVGKEQLKGVRNELRDAVDSKVEQAAGATGAFDPAEWQASKQRYGDLAEASGIANKAAAREKVNNDIGPTSWLLGAGGLAAGAMHSPVTAGLTLGAMGAREVSRRYGNQIAAVGYNNMAKLLEKSPQSLGKFADVLTNAAKQGNTALAAAHMALMSNPDYQKVVSGEGAP